jgi:hypothetical protein
MLKFLPKKKKVKYKKINENIEIWKIFYLLKWKSQNKLIIRQTCVQADIWYISRLYWN